MDIFFTSIPLADELYSNKLSLTGTLRSNKTEITNPFLVNRSREQFLSLLSFTEKLTLVSYVPKKNKSVLLLS